MSEKTIYKAESRLLLNREAALPALLIGGGAALLFTNLLHIHLIDVVWPFFLAVPALLLLQPARLATPGQRPRLGILAIPGGMLLMLSAILFLFNLTDHFEGMAYSWPLILAGGLAGWRYLRRHEPESRAHEKGTRWIRNLAALSLGLLIFFELVIFESLPGLWPLLLIVFGLFLWRRQAPKAA